MKPKSDIWWQFEKIHALLVGRKAGGVVDEATLQHLEEWAEEGKKLAEREVTLEV